MRCVTTVLTIKKATVSNSQNVKDSSHANKNLRKIKINLGTKVGICISSYSNTDARCYSVATWQTELNDCDLDTVAFFIISTVVTHRRLMVISKDNLQ